MASDRRKAGSEKRYPVSGDRFQHDYETARGEVEGLIMREVECLTQEVIHL